MMTQSSNQPLNQPSRPQGLLQQVERIKQVRTARAWG